MKLGRSIWTMLLGGLGGLVLVLPGCADDSGSNKGNASLSVTASAGSAPATLQEGAGTLTVPSSPGLTIDEMWIAFGEIEFEQEGEDMDDETDAPEYEGTFLVNLVDASGVLAQSLGDRSIPAGTYQGIEFDMATPEEPDAAPGDQLYNRSIYISGSGLPGTGGGPFVIWHNTEEEFFITGPNGIVVESGANASSLVIDFNLDVFSTVDFSPAVQNAGIYDINPQSASPANQTLAEAIQEAIEIAADFGEDQDGDGDLDDGEDVDVD